MSTILHVFWTRAVVAAVFLFLGLLTIGVSFAQDVAPAPADAVGVEAIIGMVTNSLIAGVVAITGAIGAVIWRHVPTWFTSRIDLNQTMDSIHWRENLREALADGITHARIKLKLEPANIRTFEQKNQFIAVAASFLSRFEGEIGAFFDKDQNGVPDLIEVALAKLAPETMDIGPNGPFAPGMPPQALYGSPPADTARPARASDAAVERLAQRLAPARKKGTVQ